MASNIEIRIYSCFFLNNPAYYYRQQYSFDHSYDNNRNLHYRDYSE